MTKQELENWIATHLSMRRRIVYNLDSGYKLEFENGDTYEYSYTDPDYFHRETITRINGTEARRARYISEGCGNWREVTIA